LGPARNGRRPSGQEVRLDLVPEAAHPAGVARPSIRVADET
jgi:hypothetical protein